MIKDEGQGIRPGDRLYDIAFFLVEAFSALEVTAVIVTNAHITESLGLREELSSYIITSYLYPLFAVLVLGLLLYRWISRTFSPTAFFLTGLGIFAAGNMTCFIAANPPVFFLGRFIMSIGAALAFVGQLWTVSVYHHHRLARPLVWGETGAAVGDVAGPVLGGLFAQISPEGWRGFFLLNAGLGLLTLGFAYFGLRKKILFEFQEEKPVQKKDANGWRVIGIMIAWQVAVSILLVGSEYFFSDQLQGTHNNKMNVDPLLVGGISALASVGAVFGGL